MPGRLPQLAPLSVKRLIATPAVLAATPLPASPLPAHTSDPYGGVAPFNKVRLAEFKPALIAAMAAELDDDDRIANDPAAPTFENTIAAIARAGPPLERGGHEQSVLTRDYPAPAQRPTATDWHPSRPRDRCRRAPARAR